MKTEFNSDLLRIARQARGFSQTELSKLSGLSQANISKLENGIVGPTDDILLNLSLALRFPIGFFFQTDRVIGLPMSVNFRKRASVGQKDIERLEAELNIRLLHIRRLLAATELEPELPLPRLDPDQFPGGAEEVAELLRRAWLVPSGPIRDLIGLIERAGCIVVHCDFATLQVDGFTTVVPDTPPCIFLNRNMPADRQRFSLAHELGHIVMHRFPSADMEREADVFASAFLMPRRDIRPYFSGKLSLQQLASLKPIWRVSMASLLFRARSVGAITENQSQYLWRQMSALGYRKSEPPELDLKQEHPSILPEIVRLHVEDLGYAVSELAEALHTNEEDIRNLLPLPNQKTTLRIVK